MVSTKHVVVVGGGRVLLSLLIICICSVPLAQQQETLSYDAAVVEYYPNTTKELSPDQVVEANANAYLEIINEIVTSATKKPDIVVFPEATLTANNGIVNRTHLWEFATEVLEPNTGLLLCGNTNSDKYSKAVTDISCAAKNHALYVVVNVYERVPCDVCPDPKEDAGYYNTDVVFDRQGHVIARYRKWNLFAEQLLNVTAAPEVVTFETDFNVTFGVFTCFDILFMQPTLDLVRNGVRNFVFPSMWFSELPFLSAMQVQQKWAYENDVTLLAAGALKAEYGSGGTGIYNGKQGLLNGGIQGVNDWKYYTATVPIQPERKRNSDVPALRKTVQEIDEQALIMDNFILKPDNLTVFETKLLDTTASDEIIETLCTANSSLCCNFWIRLTVATVDAAEPAQQHYKYRLAVTDNIKNFDYYWYGGVTACGLMACTDDTVDSCGKRFDNYTTVQWPVAFEFIGIEATYKNVPTSIQFPNSLLSNIEPLPVADIRWTETVNETDNTVTINYKLMQRQERLMTFAIYGRDFTKDHGPPKKDDGDGSNDAGGVSVHVYGLIMSALVALMLA